MNNSASQFEYLVQLTLTAQAEQKQAQAEQAQALAELEARLLAQAQAQEARLMAEFATVKTKLVHVTDELAVILKGFVWRN